MKFKDGIQIYPNCIYRIGNAYGYSIEDVIERYIKLNEYYLYNKELLKMHIINLDKTETRLPTDIGLFKNGKDLCLAEYAYERIVFIAPDLSEAYGEYFSLISEDFDHMDFLFDYNIIYNDFDAKKGDIFTSKYYENMYDDCISAHGDVLLKNKDMVLIDNFDKCAMYNFTSGLCVYGRVINDDGSTLRLFGGDYESFIPSALLEFKGGI